MFKTNSADIHGANGIVALVAELIYKSMWFSVTPLPFDNWRVAVKEEEYGHLEKAIATVKNKSWYSEAQPEEVER